MGNLRKINKPWANGGSRRKYDVFQGYWASPMSLGPHGKRRATVQKLARAAYLAAFAPFVLRNEHTPVCTYQTNEHNQGSGRHSHTLGMHKITGLRSPQDINCHRNLYVVVVEHQALRYRPSNVSAHHTLSSGVTEEV